MCINWRAVKVYSVFLMAVVYIQCVGEKLALIVC